MIYRLTEGYSPGRYTLGEGFILTEEGNNLTEAQAVEYVEAGILEPGEPSSEPEPEPEEEPEEGEE
jgi:hypothetical protein